MKFLVKFNLEFDLECEISDGKNRVKYGGGLSTCQGSTKIFRANFGANFRANFKQNFGNFVSNFATFFGDSVQQKGNANRSGTTKIRGHTRGFFSPREL